MARTRSMSKPSRLPVGRVAVAPAEAVLVDAGDQLAALLDRLDGGPSVRSTAGRLASGVPAGVGLRGHAGRSPPTTHAVRGGRGRPRPPAPAAAGRARPATRADAAAMPRHTAPAAQPCTRPARAAVHRDGPGSHPGTACARHRPVVASSHRYSDSLRPMPSTAATAPSTRQGGGPGRQPAQRAAPVRRPPRSNSPCSWASAVASAASTLSKDSPVRTSCFGPCDRPARQRRRRSRRSVVRRPGLRVAARCHCGHAVDARPRTGSPPRCRRRRASSALPPARRPASFMPVRAVRSSYLSTPCRPRSGPRRARPASGSRRPAPGASRSAPR